MKNIIVAYLSFIFITIGISTAPLADFNDGIIAFDRGDYKAALREFRVSAARGDARAQYNLGVMYRTGKGVSRNNQEADRWYRNAAELGHLEAQYSLGLMYQLGIIGKMYVKGKGIRKNYVKAFKWFSIAASKGHPLSKKNKNTVKSQLTPDEHTRAQRLVQEWLSIWPIIVK